MFLSAMAINTAKFAAARTRSSTEAARSNTECVSANRVPATPSAFAAAIAPAANGPPVARVSCDGRLEGESHEMNARTMIVRTALLTLTLAPTTFADAKETLSIMVSPSVSFAPANLVVVTRVEPDASNRAVEIVADSNEFYRSSTVQLEGERAPKTTRFEFHSLPPGEYEVRAAVIGADGQPKAFALAHAHVVESRSR